MTFFLVVQLYVKLVAEEEGKLQGVSFTLQAASYKRSKLLIIYWLSISCSL